MARLRGLLRRLFQRGSVRVVCSGCKGEVQVAGPLREAYRVARDWEREHEIFHGFRAPG